MCFYKLKLDENNNFEPLCERMSDFGDGFIFVNKKSFIENISFRYNPRYHTIKYYNEEEYSGKIGSFLKRNSYIHQNEYRVIIENENWAKEISKKDKIVLIKQKLLKYYQINCKVSKYPHDVCIDAHNEIEKLEKQLCEYKKRIL